MKVIKKYTAYLIVMLLLVVACTSEKSYKMLTFFFDGVPERDFTGSGSENDTVQVVDSSTVQNDLSSNRITSGFFHPPYVEKNCTACHDNTMGQKLVNQSGVCYTCHQDYESTVGFVHGPIAGGYCTSCHDPHKSDNEKLLKRKDRDLCFYCHDSKQVESNEIHSIAGELNCSECHDPHGEENAYLLKSGSCYRCHDDFSKSYTYLHGPVAAGFCNSCHATHLSESEHKLVLQGSDLCLKCHQKERILKIDSHEISTDFNCLECHNPHGGADRFILL
jgi:predicted CXXCH cytochrome family protein